MNELSPLMSEILSNGGEVVFTITGNSMYPMLRHRMDKVCLVKSPEKPLKKYDIPLYVRKDGMYVLHRIVKVLPEGYVIRGDNQWVNEYPVLHSHVIGVVKGIWRDGKYFSCEDVLYRIYCRLWVLGYPVRRLCFIGKQALKQCFGLN